jgi:hypothetical protein
MAGFVDNSNQAPIIQRIRDSVKTLSTFGMKYDDLVVKNSQAIGATEANFLRSNKIDDEATLYSLAQQDTQTKQYISYYDKDYKGKREYLRKFALNSEIDYLLDLVADEAISYDPKHFFAYPAFLNFHDFSDKMMNGVNSAYKKIYDVWGFGDDISAWQLFRQFLVEGFLSFEIVYDDKGKNIIGFKELDPVTLLPSVEKQPNGSYLNVWIQYPEDEKKRRVLYDSQIIYISYAKGNSVSRISYVERLIRPYNVLRIMEYTRVIWSVMNASFRLKMTVPIGSKSPQKAMQTLGELMSIYKEDVKFDNDTGELLVDGRPKIQFYKNYMIPSGTNGTPTIEPVNISGPNLSDTTPIQYFWEKFLQESKIPVSRFSGPDFTPQGAVGTGAEGLDKDEIRFSKFINRLRSVFQEILTKPLYYQLCSDFPAVKNDFSFKSQIGLSFVTENPFRINQEIEVLSKKKDAVVSLAGLTDDFEKPYFSLNFLIRNMLGMSADDLRENEEVKKKIKREKEKLEKAGQEIEASSSPTPVSPEPEAPPVEEPETPTETAPE